MSTIPFVEQLGDAIQAAIADPAVARRRRTRRRLVVAVTTLLLLGGSLAAAQLLNEPEKLATGCCIWSSVKPRPSRSCSPRDCTV